MPGSVDLRSIAEAPFSFNEECFPVGRGPRRSGGEEGGEDQGGMGEREEGRTNKEWGRGRRGVTRGKKGEAGGEGGGRGNSELRDCSH